MTIVVGVDGSHGATKALHWAMEEAALRGSDVIAVWAFVVPTFTLGPEAMSVPAVTLEDMRASTGQALASFVQRERGARPEVEVVERSVSGPAASALRNEADEASAELLVVGSRGLGGFKGLLLGSVSSQCVHHPPRCPVVVVSADPKHEPK